MGRISAAALAKEKAESVTPPEDAVPDKRDQNVVSCRTTVVFPLPLNENWEAFSLKMGRPKNEILIVALKEYLARHGLQPDRRPRLEVSY